MNISLLSYVNSSFINEKHESNQEKTLKNTIQTVRKIKKNIIVNFNLK